MVHLKFCTLVANIYCSLWFSFPLLISVEFVLEVSVFAPLSTFVHDGKEVLLFFFVSLSTFTLSDLNSTMLSLMPFAVNLRARLLPTFANRSNLRKSLSVIKLFVGKPTSFSGSSVAKTVACCTSL